MYLETFDDTLLVGRAIVPAAALLGGSLHAKLITAALTGFSPT